MDLTPTPAEQDIADSVAEYLAAEVQLAKLRQRLAGTGPLIDQATWVQWAEMGFFSLGMPEHAGGLGLGVAGESLIFEQFGWHLTPGPLISTALAVGVAIDAGDTALSRQLMDGSVRVGQRVGTTGFDVEVGGLMLSVEQGGARIELVGDVKTLSSIDPMIELAVTEPGETLVEVAGPETQIRAWILAGAVLLGIARATEHQSTAYALIRRQFDKPIGSFQAVKHRCADMRTRSYAAESQLRFAVLSVVEEQVDARLQTAAALELCVDAARANTANNIQNHGGIGFTNEHDAGLYLKRAVVVQKSLGSPSAWKDVLLAPGRTVFA